MVNTRRQYRRICRRDLDLSHERGRCEKFLSVGEKEFEENKNWQRKMALKTDFNVLG